MNSDSYGQWCMMMLKDHWWLINSKLFIHDHAVAANIGTDLCWLRNGSGSLITMMVTNISWSQLFVDGYSKDQSRGCFSKYREPHTWLVYYSKWLIMDDSRGPPILRNQHVSDENRYRRCLAISRWWGHLGQRFQMFLLMRIGDGEWWSIQGGSPNC